METNRPVAIIIGCWLYNSLLLTSFIISCPICSLSGKITQFHLLQEKRWKYIRFLFYLRNFSAYHIWDIFNILDWYSPIYKHFVHQILYTYFHNHNKKLQSWKQLFPQQFIIHSTAVIWILRFLLTTHLRSLIVWKIIIRKMKIKNHNANFDGIHQFLFLYIYVYI